MSKSDVDLDEILKRLVAAEQLVAQARSMLIDALDAADEAEIGEEPTVPHKLDALEEVAEEVASTVGGMDVQLLRERFGAPSATEGFRSAVVSLFRLAMEPPVDPDLLSELLRGVMHSDSLLGDRAMGDLQHFAWARFLKQLDAYVGRPGDPTSFNVVRTRPDEISDDTIELRVYIEARGRLPAPVRLERDPARDNAWRVREFSL